MYGTRLVLDLSDRSEERKKLSRAIYTNWYIQFIHLTFFLLWEIAFNVVLLIPVLMAMKKI